MTRAQPLSAREHRVSSSHSDPSVFFLASFLRHWYWCLLNESVYVKTFFFFNDFYFQVKQDDCFSKNRLWSKEKKMLCLANCNNSCFLFVCFFFLRSSHSGYIKRNCAPGYGKHKYKYNFLDNRTYLERNKKKYALPFAIFILLSLSRLIFCFSLAFFLFLTFHNWTKLNML